MGVSQKTLVRQHHLISGTEKQCNMPWLNLSSAKLLRSGHGLHAAVKRGLLNLLNWLLYHLTYSLQGLRRLRPHTGKDQGRPTHLLVQVKLIPVGGALNSALLASPGPTIKGHQLIRKPEELGRGTGKRAFLKTRPLREPQQERLGVSRCTKDGMPLITQMARPLLTHVVVFEPSIQIAMQSAERRACFKRWRGSPQRPRRGKYGSARQTLLLSKHLPRHAAGRQVHGCFSESTA